jgi:hypothetical protein
MLLDESCIELRILMEDEILHHANLFCIFVDPGQIEKRRRTVKRKKLLFMISKACESNDNNELLYLVYQQAGRFCNKFALLMPCSRW